jgi:hypothetical protein
MSLLGVVACRLEARALVANAIRLKACPKTNSADDCSWHWALPPTVSLAGRSGCSILKPRE